MAQGEGGRWAGGSPLRAAFDVRWVLGSVEVTCNEVGVKVVGLYSRLSVEAVGTRERPEGVGVGVWRLANSVLGH